MLIADLGLQRKQNSKKSRCEAAEMTTTIKRSVTINQLSIKLVTINQLSINT